MNKLILNKYYSLNAESYVSVEVYGAYRCILMNLYVEVEDAASNINEVGFGGVSIKDKLKLEKLFSNNDS